MSVLITPTTRMVRVKGSAFYNIHIFQALAEIKQCVSASLGCKYSTDDMIFTQLSAKILQCT